MNRYLRIFVTVLRRVRVESRRQPSQCHRGDGTTDGRVPGVATSPLGDADLAELMNWILWRFDREHLPANFQPFTAAEMGRLRGAPLRLEASQMRADLLKKADESAAP